jgi:hypothetical protein
MKPDIFCLQKGHMSGFMSGCIRYFIIMQYTGKDNMEGIKPVIRR